MKIPKGKVGIVVTVKIIDPANPKKKYHKVCKGLAREAMQYLSIRLDPQVMEALYK